MLNSDSLENVQSIVSECSEAESLSLNEMREVYIIIMVLDVFYF